MSIFSRILEKLTGHAQAAPPTVPSAVPSASPAPTDAQPGTGTATAASATTTPVDVTAVMNGLASQSKQRLDWQHSIVDMMKLLEMDSSLDARKSLAKELNYSGDTNDSAAMNIWLHKQVMQKLAENGGKVPAELMN